MEEVWRYIVDGQPHMVSNLGRVKGSKGLMKPWKLDTGYMQIKIQRKAFSVHRQVAYKFCEGWFEGAVVNHKNGLRHDNRAENLEWTTNSENIRHGYRVLGAIGPYLGKFSKDHNTSKAVTATSLLDGSEISYDCAMDAVRAGYSSPSISRCCHGLQKSHKGYRWSFSHNHGVKWSPTSLGAL